MSKNSRKAKKQVDNLENRDSDVSAQRTLVGKSLLPHLTLLLAAFAVYANALFGEFVWDDEFQIVGNPWIRNIRNIPAIFSNSAWAFESGKANFSSNYYRPLMHCVYLLDYRLFGLNPLGFHLVNILFHCGVTILVFLTIRMLLPESQEASFYLSPAFLAAFLFALHPIHTEAVTWIAGLPDAAFTFFYLLSFYLYVKSKSLLSSSYVCSVACFAVAALFKEPALTLPAILLTYDTAVRKERISLADSVKRYIPYVAVGTGYLAVRLHVLRGFAPDQRFTDLSFYQCVINVFPLFGCYLEKLVFPINLCNLYEFHPIAKLFESKEFLYLIATVAYVILALVALQKSRVAFLGLMVVLVPLLPVLYIRALGGTAFAERYLYLPSVGYVLLLAVFIAWTKEKQPDAAKFVLFACIVMAGVYAVGTMRRNFVWQNNLTLWADTVKKAPYSLTAHSNLAILYKERNMPYKAIEEFEAAIRLKPDADDLHTNLGSVYGSLSMFDKALDEFLIALTLNPNNQYAHYDLGLVYLLTGRADSARREFATVLAINPHNDLARQKLIQLSR